MDRKSFFLFAILAACSSPLCRRERRLAFHWQPMSQRCDALHSWLQQSLSCRVGCVEPESKAGEIFARCCCCCVHLMGTAHWEGFPRKLPRGIAHQNEQPISSYLASERKASAKLHPAQLERPHSTGGFIRVLPLTSQQVRPPMDLSSHRNRSRINLASWRTIM